MQRNKSRRFFLGSLHIRVPEERRSFATNSAELGDYERQVAFSYLPFHVEEGVINY